MGINELLNIGSKMKKIRIKNGIPQKEMAKLLNLSVSTYSNYENGHREPPEDIITKFCNELNISLAELLGLGGLGNIAKRGLDILNQAKKQTCFIDYLNSLGYEFVDGSLYDAPDSEIGMLHIKEMSIDIPLTRDDFDKLEKSISNNIELEIYRLEKEIGV